MLFEKVGDGAPARNNRIASDDFLNRTCSFGGRLESILFRGPPQNPFSIASTHNGLVEWGLKTCRCHLRLRGPRGHGRSFKQRWRSRRVDSVPAVLTATGKMPGLDGLTSSIAK